MPTALLTRVDTNHSSLALRCVQASIGRDAGVAVITALYMGLFLWLRPFRTRHRSRLCTSYIVHVRPARWRIHISRRLLGGS